MTNTEASNPESLNPIIPPKNENTINDAGIKDKSKSEKDNVQVPLDATKLSPVNSPQQNQNTEVIYSRVEKNRQAVIANWISFSGIVVSIVLATFTYLLFLKTVESNQTSKDAVRETEKAVIEATRANDIALENLNFARQSNIADDSINKRTITLSEHALDAQIRSINTSQKQFEAVNQPFLYLGKINLLGPELNNYINFEITLQNLSEIPVKLLSKKYGYRLTNDTTTIVTFESIKKYSKEIPSTGYLSKDAPMIYKTTSDIQINYQIFNSLKISEAFIYVVWEFKYQNLVTNKIRVFSFFAIVKHIENNPLFPNNTYVEIVKSDNIDL